MHFRILISIWLSFEGNITLCKHKKKQKKAHTREYVNQNLKNIIYRAFVFYDVS